MNKDIRLWAWGRLTSSAHLLSGGKHVLGTATTQDTLPHSVPVQLPHPSLSDPASCAHSPLDPEILLVCSIILEPDTG
ncbi:mCG57491 [Mus musculus]|nr:mCG57491 [Mus musculus]